MLEDVWDFDKKKRKNGGRLYYFSGAAGISFYPSAGGREAVAWSRFAEPGKRIHSIKQEKNRYWLSLNKRQTLWVAHDAAGVLCGEQALVEAETHLQRKGVLNLSSENI